jgi:peptidoglycan hydrolase-like protein with peptidoglycan-binding domain
MQPSPSASRPKSPDGSDLSPGQIRAIAASAQIPAMLAPAPSAPAAPTAPARTLRQGMSGDDVRGLQLALNAIGQKVDVDSQFGPQTTAAVKAVQQQAGLKPSDGIVGPATRQALQTAYARAVTAAGANPLAP